MIFDIKNGTTLSPFDEYQWIFFSLSMLILDQKCCYLRPTILEIPQPQLILISIHCLDGVAEINRVGPYAVRPSCQKNKQMNYVP